MRNYEERAATLRPPALTAFMAYLRPTPRAQLLPRLADLGIFVVEHQGVEGLLEDAALSRPDMALLLADDNPSHSDIAARIVHELTPALVAIVPSTSSGAALLEAGAAVCLTDDDLDGDLSVALAPATRLARRLHDQEAPADDLVVFGDIGFQRWPPALVRRERRVDLTEPEAIILQVLAHAIGQPTAAAQLELRLAEVSRSAPPADLRAIVLKLRRRVEALGGNASLLRTVRGFGYVLMA